jgi:hypothetical protein
MRVFLTGPHGYSSVHNEPNLTLSSFLRQKGWTLVHSSEESDVVCAIEMPLDRLHLPDVPDQVAYKGLLVIQEPAVVRPFHDSERFISRFRKTLFIGRPSGSDGVKWPALYLERFTENSEALKKHKACLIASNKVSLLSGELYTLRRKAIEGSEDIDLFGPNWDSSLMTRLKQVAFEFYLCAISSKKPQLRSAIQFLCSNLKSKGVVADKLVENRNYKVSVVIENSSDYMSEKLLEAISAASIPVYVGPDVSHFGIPSGLVVQVNGDADSVRSGIEIALQMDFDDWVKRCKTWLADRQIIENWSLTSYWENIHQNLLLLMKENQTTTK